MATGPLQRSSRRRVSRLSRATDRQEAAMASQPARLEDILITEKLKSRRRRKPNAHAENAAMQGLARVMASAPNDLIDTLLRTALELCSAGTAGLSEPGWSTEEASWANYAAEFQSLRRDTRSKCPAAIRLSRPAFSIF